MVNDSPAITSSDPASRRIMFSFLLCRMALTVLLTGGVTLEAENGVFLEEASEEIPVIGITNEVVG